MSSAAATWQSTCCAGTAALFGRERKTELKAQLVMGRLGVSSLFGGWNGIDVDVGVEVEVEVEGGGRVLGVVDVGGGDATSSGIPCGIALRLLSAASSAGCRYPSNQRLKHESYRCLRGVHSSERDLQVSTTTRGVKVMARQTAVVLHVHSWYSLHGCEMGENGKREK